MENLENDLKKLNIQIKELELIMADYKNLLEQSTEYNWFKRIFKPVFSIKNSKICIDITKNI